MSCPRILTNAFGSRTCLLAVLIFSLYLTGSPGSGIPGPVRSRSGFGAAQDPPAKKGGAGPVFGDPQANSVAVPAVTVVDHKTTGTEPAANCTTPTAKASFAPTDPSVYEWALLSGAVIGDVVKWDFRQPDGSTYFVTDPVTLTFNGSVCLWGFINIAGFPAASQLGNWEVRLIYNNTIVATDTFSLRNDTVVLTDHRITGTTPTSCTPPPIKTTFAPTDPSVSQWTLVSGAKSGDQVKWEFIQPNGTVYATSSVLTLTNDGSVCFYISLNIAGQPAAALLGTWQVRVIYNNIPLLPSPDTFTIAQAVCPAVTSINPSSGVAGSTVSIVGTNLTGVTAVKFGGITATFNVVSATSITATVPANAVSGPLTLSKPNCSDVQTPVFTVITNPIIEVTPSSLSFGTVAVGSAITRQVTLKNIGAGALLFTSVSSNQPEFVVQASLSGIGLQSSGSLTVTVSFVPTSGGAKTGTLSINSNDPAQPGVSLQMTGTALAPVLEVAPNSLQFGDLALGQSKDLILSLRNNGSSELIVTNVASANQLFAPIRYTEKPSNVERNLPLVISPGGLVEVSVRFRPSFIANSIGNQVSVLTISSNEPGRPQVDVPLAGRGIGPALSAPASLSLGSVAICSGSPATAPLTLTNIGNAPLTIVGLATNSTVFSLIQRPTLPVTLAAGASLQVTVGFTTRTTGNQTANLVVSSNAVNNRSFSVALSAVGTPLPAPSVGSLVASRTTLAHGRIDSARPASVFNPFGLADVIGFAFPGGALPLNSIAPGLVPPALIGFPGLPPAAILSAPDPLRITLAGGAANPIVASAANIPSSFSLVVAEGIVAPDLTIWERVGSRFGSGNLYATVAIPGTSIFPGMELVTDADLQAYSANSIIYEAPDFGFVVAPAGQNGGTASLQARARRIPANTQCATVTSSPQSTQIEFSRTVRIEILTDRTVITRVPGGLELSVTAQISGNFDPPPNTVVRWGFDGNSVDIVIDQADMTSPGAPRLLTHTFHLPADEECKLVQVTAVASSTGNVPPVFLPPINPFLVLAPATIDLFTFRSGGTTVEDTRAVLLKLADSNCAGGSPVSWIRGAITNAITGATIRGASVSIVGTNISALSGIDGGYELNNVPTGVVTLSVSADGFISKQVQVSLTPGQVTSQDVSLTPNTGTISGRIYDLVTFQPIAGAGVSIKGSEIAAVSGADGSFVLSGVPVGPQTVTASKTGFTADEESVNVIGDLTTAVDLFLLPTLGRITGTVRNATTNQPIAGASVSAAGISATTDAAGAYVLNDIPEGSQAITVTANDYNPGGSTVSVPGGGSVASNISLQPLLGTVSGFVRNADTNDPVSGATVSLAGTSLSATTGASGSYTIDNVPVGPRSISASATGFVTAQASVTVLGNSSVLVDISLAPTKGAITGTVIDSVSLQPVGGVEVELLPFPLSFDTTNAGGQFTLADVGIGPQVILATKSGYFPMIVVVNVQANQTATQEIRITPSLGTVVGEVRDDFSQGVGNIFVTAPGTGAGTLTGQDGKYTLNSVPAGTRTLEAAQSGYTTQQVTREIKGGETIHQSFVISRKTGSISGTVKDADTGQLILNGFVTTFVGGPLMVSGSFLSTNGSYTLSRVPPGNHGVNASAEGYEPGGGQVEVTEGQTATLDIQLRKVILRGGIKGSVKDALTSNPLPGATVSLSGTASTRTTNADGEYAFGEVPVGSHTVSAVKQGYQGNSVQVTVVENQTVSADIQLSPLPTMTPGTITGTVRDAANANPIVGASITLQGTNFATTSGAGGSYTLSNVPPENYTLVASANGFISTQIPVTVASGQTLTQNISLSPTLPAGEIRITLNWTKNGEGHPRDLDAHLVGPNPDGSCFHVYYSNKGNLAAAPFAQLEVDNISITGAPPLETIRIAKLSAGIYRYYVYNYSGEDPDGLAVSRATVQIFGASGSLGSFVVPSGNGRYWTVFEINGQTGAVRTLNKLADPSSSCTTQQP